MDLLSLHLFVRISELGTISAAARDLSLSPPSASARLTKLEQTIGARLFNRTTREVSLTTDGTAFLPYAQDSLEALEAGLQTVAGRADNARGLLRMTMPGSFGRMYVVPELAKFRARFPEITLDLRLSDEVLDLVKGAFDLVIRNAALDDSTLIARQLAPDKRVLVASPEYIDRHGSPSTPAELSNHSCVTFPGERSWHFEKGASVKVNPTVTVNDGEAMRQLLESGAGLGVKSMWNAARSLRAGRLVQVMPDYPLVTHSAIWAVHPSGRIVAPKVRAMIRFLSDLFAPIPPWEQPR